MSQPRIIPILTYHSLDDSGSVLSVSPRVFVEQMQILHKQGARVVSLGELRNVLSGPAVPNPLVAITFDDGFQSVYEFGLPILQRYGFTATVFLVTDYCGKTNSWPSQPLHIERRPLLRWSEIKEMSAAGITFGSHTRTHPDLRALSSRNVEEELVASKKIIEDATGRPVNMLAYPYGTYDDTVKHVAKAHFSLACSTRLDFVRPGSDLFALERLDMYYLRRRIVFQRLFSREMGAYVRFRRGLRALRGRVPRWLNRLIAPREAYDRPTL